MHTESARFGFDGMRDAQRPTRRHVGFVTAIALTVGLVSCSVPPASSDGQVAHAEGSAFAGPVPEFRGPYAVEFAEAYRSTTDNVVREILAKESITDQDYATAAGIFVKCMANKGFTVEIDGPAGEMSIPNALADDAFERANSASEGCNSGWSALCALRGQILRNPQHLDENEIVAACLVRSGIAPPSYTPKDYARDLETWNFPYSTSSMEFNNCVGDPLGLASRSAGN